MRSIHGQSLRIVTGNEFAADGICNQFGSYGSKYSSTSIFNQFTTYGSNYSPASAYSAFPSTPPRIFCADSAAAVSYVTKNSILTPRIDPDRICEVLRQSGI